MPKKTKEEKKVVTNVEKKPISKKASSNSSTKKVNKVDTTVKTTRSKKVTAKQVSKKETVTRKNASKSTKNKSTNSTNSVLEYYDLPYRYNQTIVKILAQTPNTLFVYWDISDADKIAFKERYGDNFFNITKPILIVYNQTMNYSFEIEINDFANSWYLQVKDPNCKYTIELGRKPYTYTSSISEKYIYVSSSNEINTPNNHILFEKFNTKVMYKNINNNSTFIKNFDDMSSYKNMRKIYNIYNLYKEIYRDDLFKEIANGNIFNPSSGSSSSFK